MGMTSSSVPQDKTNVSHVGEQTSIQFKEPSESEQPSEKEKEK